MQVRLNLRAVFLDRDGVLNRCEVVDGKPYAPRKLSDFRLLPGAAQAVTDLKAAGFLIFVVTNQPDLGHGLITTDIIRLMHTKLCSKAPIDEIMLCPHRQDVGCACRKPKPGMLLDAMQRWSVDPSRSFMIGDRWSDVVAGRTAGLFTIFIDRGYAERLTTQPDLTVTSLRQATTNILAH